jgi:hypothetical protein
MKKIWVIILAAWLFSCNHGSTDGSTDFDPVAFYAEFQRRRAAWEELNIDHYQFIGHAISNAYRDGPATVTVFPDRKPEIVVHNPGNIILFPGDDPFIPFPDDPFMPFRGSTISELFASLDTSINDLLEFGLIFCIDYNERYHFPERMRAWVPPPGEPGGVGLDITAFEDLRGN